MLFFAFSLSVKSVSSLFPPYILVLILVLLLSGIAWTEAGGEHIRHRGISKPGGPLQSSFFAQTQCWVLRKLFTAHDASCFSARRKDLLGWFTVVLWKFRINGPGKVDNIDVLINRIRKLSEKSYHFSQGHSYPSCYFVFSVQWHALIMICYYQLDYQKDTQCKTWDLCPLPDDATTLMSGSD